MKSRTEAARFKSGWGWFRTVDPLTVMHHDGWVLRRVTDSCLLLVPGRGTPTRSTWSKKRMYVLLSFKDLHEEV